MALPDTQTAAVGQKEGKYYNCGRPKKKKNKIRNVQKCAREQLRFHKTPEILNNNKSEIYACV